MSRKSRLLSISIRCKSPTMQDIVINHQGQPATTSRLISEKFKKRHDDVLKAVRNLECSDEFRIRNFAATPYTHPQNGQTYYEYIITRDGFAFLVMGFTGAEAASFKEEYIAAFNRMEQALRNRPAQALTRKELAQMLLDAENEIEQLQATNELQGKQLVISGPKVQYHDTVLQSTSLIATTIIAKELGMSAITLNKKLHEMGIQHMINGVWVLYAKYQDQGWTGIKTATYTDTEGRERTIQHTYWTQKGRHYIHTLFNSKLTCNLSR